MADSIEVTLTLGYDSLRPDSVLHQYLTAPLPTDCAPAQKGGPSGQSLTAVAGAEISRDLPGSGQAGTVRIYAGSIRRGCASDILDWLKAAPWSHHEAVLVIHGGDGPAMIERLGHVPSEPGWN